MRFAGGADRSMVADGFDCERICRGCADGGRLATPESARHSGVLHDIDRSDGGRSSRWCRSARSLFVFMRLRGTAGPTAAPAAQCDPDASGGLFHLGDSGPAKTFAVQRHGQAIDSFAAAPR